MRAQKITRAEDGFGRLVILVGSFVAARFHIFFVSIQSCSPQTLKPRKLCCKANPCLLGLRLYLCSGKNGDAHCRYEADIPHLLTLQAEPKSPWGANT